MEGRRTAGSGKHARRWLVLCFTVFVTGWGLSSLARDVPESQDQVLVVAVEGIVDLGMAPFIERVVAEASEIGAKAIVLDINTLGGRVDAAILIRDALVESQVPTVAFIHPRAISAGAFISLACQKIAMVPGGSIGAATPVTGGAEEMEAAEEKVVSYWRSEMRSTAERNGRRGDIAEAMVDRDVEIEGLSEAGKLLTLTTDDALRLGVVDFVAADREEVLGWLGLGEAVVLERRLNWAERIARVLSHPALSSLLMSLGFLGILIELYQPGWGIPGTIGVVCLVLFFLGHYVVNLAGWEELLLFALGLALVGLEVFVIPGFGVAGVAGIATILVALFLALLSLDLRVSWELGLVDEALTVTAGGMLGVVVGGALALRFLPRSRAGSVFILRRGLGAEKGFVSHGTTQEEAYAAGTQGIALRDLRPAGTIRVGSVRLDAVSEGSFVKRGTTVTIVGWRAGQPVVRPLEEEAAGEAAEPES